MLSTSSRSSASWAAVLCAERCNDWWRRLVYRTNIDGYNDPQVELCEDIRGDDDSLSQVTTEDTSATYRVKVDGFHVSRRNTIFYLVSVSHGAVTWPIRRRFRQVVRMHNQVQQSLANSTASRCLPPLPPKMACRALCYGSRSERFLSVRVEQLQNYLQDLLLCIPTVDQCVALRNFLCSMDLAHMSYDDLLELGEAVGYAKDASGADPAAIAALPQSVASKEGVNSVLTGGQCTICQDNLELDEDIRVLPCGHEYHYNCIAQWLPRRNACCICQATAVVETEADSQD